MKISFIYNRCYLGGVESATKNKIDCLTQLGVDCQIIFLRTGFEKQTFKDNKYFVTDNDDKISALTKHSDAIINLSPDDVIFDRLYKLNKPIIHECHCGVDLSYLSMLNTDLVKAVIYPTQYRLELGLLQVPKSIPSFSLPNCPVNNNEISLEQVKKPIKRVILWIGRIEHCKNWMVLVKLAEKLSSDYLIKMVSDLTYSNDYIKFQGIIKNGAFQDKIQLLPNFSYSEIFKCYREAAFSGCYLSSSYSETFGMTLLEAMGTHCPMVLSDIPAFREIAKDCALYFSPNDIDTCLDSIYKICENGELRENMVKKQYENLKANYDPIKICNQYINLLKKVLN